MLKKYKLRNLIKVAVSFATAVVLVFTLVVPGSAVEERVGRFGDVNGSDGLFKWKEDGKEKTLNYFYVGDSVLANQAYCIDHATSLNDGTIRTGTECDLGYGSDFWKRFSEETKKGIMYALLYGYNGKDNKVPDQLKARNLNISTMDYLAATQFLVWEYSMGYRKNATTLNNSLFYNYIKGRRAEVAYNYILEQIAAHEVKASFLSKANDKASAQSYVMKWNQSAGRYETVVTDENGNSFDWTIIGSGSVKVSRQGNKYTFYSTEKISNYTVEIKKYIPTGVIASGNTFKLVVFDGNGQSLTRGKWDPMKYYMNFSTEEDGRIVVNKTSEDGIVENVKFVLSGKGLASPISKATDATGKTEFSGLKPGKYTVTEVVNEEKYVVPAPVTINVEAGVTKEISFHNELVEYSFKIKKHVMETEYSEGCATFTFKITGDNLPEPIFATTHWIQSIKNNTVQVGEVTVRIPGPGHYTVEEVDTGEKFTSEILNTDVIQITQEGDNGSLWFRNTPKKGILKIKKTSEDGVVEGVTFTITGENLSSPLSLVTDENGEISKDLLIGKYTITETAADEYVSQGERIVDIVFNETVELSFANILKRGDLKIIKTSDNGKVSGKRFIVTATNGGEILLSDGSLVEKIELITDDNGVAMAEKLPVGDYTVSETDNSVAYEDFVSATAKLTDEGSVVTLYMHNSLKMGSVVLHKTSEDGILGGHRFLIYGKVFNPEGFSELDVIDFSAEAVTNEEGYASFKVPVNIVSKNGKVYKADESGFTIVEVGNEKYEKLSPITGIFVEQDMVANGGPININNILKKGSVKVLKESEDGVVEGVSFKLSGRTFYGKEVSLSGITDKNGELVFTGLAPSDENGYTITETDTPDYYEPQESVSVKIQVDKVVNVEFNNILKKGTVKVIKSSEDGFVEGFTFVLHGTSAAGENVIMRSTTNSEGTAVFENVPISDGYGYILEEEKVPVKYVVPDKESVVVNWNEETSVKVLNTLKRIISPVVKTDETGNVLEGAGLAVYTHENELVFAGLTDEKGMLAGLELVVGKKYFVREFLAPVGYVLDETLREFVVLDDGTVEGDYSFTNQLIPTPEPTPVPVEAPTEEPAVPTPIPTKIPEITERPALTAPPTEVPPETGDNNNFKPYVVIACVAIVAGVVIMVILKKHAEEENVA